MDSIGIPCTKLVGVPTSSSYWYRYDIDTWYYIHVVLQKYVLHFFAKTPAKKLKNKTGNPTL